VFPGNHQDRPSGESGGGSTGACTISPIGGSSARVGRAATAANAAAAIAAMRK
jgi:hypothetical protein